MLAGELVNWRAGELVNWRAGELASWRVFVLYELYKLYNFMN